MYCALKIEEEISCGFGRVYFEKYQKALDEINSKNGTIVKIDTLDSGGGDIWNRCCIITYKIDSNS